MPINVIHVSDIHFGSGESHGRINPRTGLNIRFEDFAAAFVKVVDFALDKKADLFLFTGDAYKNATPEPIYQQAFAEQLKRLSDAKIPTVLLVGNHDQILKGGSSHSMSVFQSLDIPGITVIGKPELLKLKTKNGNLQLIGIPHITRHMLMTHDKYATLSASEIDRVLAKHISEILNDLYEELDPKTPTIACAHMMMDNARAGAEQELMLGYSMTFPIEIFINDKLDYVALGHVHGHQILRAEQPLIAYAGSLERVDFGEEFEDKGFIEIKIKRGAKPELTFHSINPRPFTTVEVDLTKSEDPTEDLLKIAKKNAVEGAVFRAIYQIQQNRLGEVDEERIKLQLPQFLSVRFKPQLVYLERPRRMPEISEQAVLQPLAALEKYFDELGVGDKDALMERATSLVRKLENNEQI